VLGAGPSAARPGDYELYILKDGAPLLATPVTGDDFTFGFPSVGTGRYRLQLQRNTAIEAVSSPIYVESPSYVRPRGATPLRVSLVPAFRACTSPDAMHGAPLAFPSCSTPHQESSVLTVGTPDANAYPVRSVAHVRFDALLGDPATSADEADVALAVSATDVRCAAVSLACPDGPGSDFEGRTLLNTTLRITDRDNGTALAADVPATVSDLALEIPVTCGRTDGPTGSTCATATTLDAVFPGAVKEGARTIWELGSIALDDPGPNGSGFADGCPSTCGDGDESPFLRQGVAIP
jgi:hypothetical protein